MPNTPRQNIAKWDELAEIHYYSHFITTWIAFNSWYNFSFPDIVGDRAVINHIKNNHTLAKTTFLGLLRGTNQESKQFQENIAQLHYCLQNHNISSDGQRIWFESFVVELDRSKLIINQTSRGVKYHVNITITQGNITTILATVKNAANSNLLVYNHNAFDIVDLKSKPEFIALSNMQKATIEGYLNEANPKKPVNLLTNNQPPNCIEVGQFKLINNENLIFKAIIEMLYGLRNNLFHGSLTPSPDANKVYEAAYRILKQIVEDLK
ncbi:MAG: hypothetical protein A2X12_07485 [Bacteroidetes bacterium GWE2_29_8]|nr:MAG: hypothetical protein A2X12_07485 [Bacteroidetes bacterium GWE2_29_8]